MKRLIFLLSFAAISACSVGCGTTDYFKDESNPRLEAMEDRRDRRALKREEKDTGLTFRERTEDWWELKRRERERDEWSMR
ncbi:MAG: hypothetical protein AAGA58_10070 [Verrucomicrobiota bacterium]